MTHTTNNSLSHTQIHIDYLHFRSGSPFLTQTYRKGTNFTFTALLVAYSHSLLLTVCLSSTATLLLLVHSVSCCVVSVLLSMRVFSAYTLHFYAHFIHKLHGIFIVPQEVFPRNYPNALPCLFGSAYVCVASVCVCLITSLRDLSLASLQSPCGNCA